MTPVILPLVALLSCWSATPQSIGASVSGIVTDETGARLPDATVTITHMLNGRSWTAKTGREGDFRAGALLPGEYEISVVRGGFRTASRRVALAVGADATVNLTLSLEAIEVTTTAVAESSLVEVARAGPMSVITRREIEKLPMLDRNFLVMAQLLPGSGPINGTVNRLATTKFGGPADQRVGYATLIDGGDISDAVWGSPTINVGQEAVQEFTVFRHQFDAQYGHALSAIVTVATRSGTNRFSGSGFYYGRDDALNARYAFATEQLPFEEWRAGGSIGGPLVRDRSHFFVSFERDRVDTVRVIALGPENQFASVENGVFPAATDNSMASARWDHRFDTRSFSMRYARDRQQSMRAGTNVSSDSSQIDIANRSHSLVIEDAWMARPNIINTARAHVLWHTLGTTPRDSGTAIKRLSVSTGLTTGDAWVASTTRLTVSDALDIHTPRTEIKIGAELALGAYEMDSHVFERGFFEFATDTAFNPSVSSTWPTVFTQQKPASSTYRSQEIGVFAQSDWRLRDRLHLNAGLRYDIDLNLRLNGFYGKALDDPRFTGLDRFVSGDRGTDTNNLQPRLGATWDARGNGTFLVRAAWGLYVTRNRPWFQLRSMNQFDSTAVRVASPSTSLRFFPDTGAVLGGLDLDAYLSTVGGRQIGTLIPDDFEQPYAMNTTAGIAWQVNGATSVNVDYVHAFADLQTGTTDVNLPATGKISATNPRPVAAFSQVGMLQNFSRSWYDAIESQMRTRFGSRGSLLASYTLSRSFLDGVDFFLNMRGTQRTPHERGYNPSDQRHNLTLAGTVTLPWAVELSGILKLVSGAPIKVQAGIDLDGDSVSSGDLPEGVPITVGRDRVDATLDAINAFRAGLNRGLLPIARPALALDAFRTLDLRVTRSWRAGRDRQIQLVVEAFNVTNRTNLRPPTGPGANISSPSFLSRTAARDARQVQWGVRYLF